MKIQNEHRSQMACQARRDKTMTALLTGVVLVLIICHTPKTIINVYESYQVKAGWWKTLLATERVSTERLLPPNIVRFNI